MLHVFTAMEVKKPQIIFSVNVFIKKRLAAGIDLLSDSETQWKMKEGAAMVFAELILKFGYRDLLQLVLCLFYLAGEESRSRASLWNIKISWGFPILLIDRFHTSPKGRVEFHPQTIWRGKRKEVHD